MKNLKKIATARLLVIILLLAVCMAGCAAPAESNGGIPSKTDAPAESDSSGAPADAPQALTLPILDEIDADVAVGTAGSSLLAVQAAVKLLDWGVNTGLDTDEISGAASAWLTTKNDDRTECLQKLELVDEAYQKLLTDEARELLDDAGCAEVEITWGSVPQEQQVTTQEQSANQPSQGYTDPYDLFDYFFGNGGYSGSSARNAA